jgi:DNA-binding beta-propeller fold protein YncE
LPVYLKARPLIDMRYAYVTACVAILSVSVGCTSPTKESRGAGRSPERGSDYIHLAPHGFPQDVAVGYGSVWVSTREGDGGAILRIDPATTDIIAVIDTPDRYPPFRLAAGAGAVWASTGGEGSGQLLRIDPDRDAVVAAIPVKGGPQELAAGQSAVWVQTLLPLDQGTIARVDPATNEVTAFIRLHGQAADVAARGEEVWALDGGGAEGRVVRIDPGINRVGLSRGLRNPYFMNELVAGESGLWVASQIRRPFSTVIRRIDPVTLDNVGDPVRLGGGISEMTAGQDSLWAWAGVKLAEVRPATGQVLRSIRVRSGGSAHGLSPGMTVGYGAMWLTGRTNLIRLAL